MHAKLQIKSMDIEGGIHIKEIKWRPTLVTLQRYSLFYSCYVRKETIKS